MTDLEQSIAKAIVDVVEAVLFRAPSEDPRKLALDLAAEHAHRIAVKAEINRELKAPAP